jgi:transcriptional regulator with XRE-family HTH domain
MREMTNTKEIFAKNLRENRRKCGLTQAKLAEMAGVSTHYVALIELARNIPKVETIERFAKALDIEIYELFTLPLSPELEIKKIHRSIAADLKDIIKEAITDAIEEAFEKEKKKKKKRN